MLSIEAFGGEVRAYLDPPPLPVQGASGWPIKGRATVYLRADRSRNRGQGEIWANLALSSLERRDDSGGEIASWLEGALVLQDPRWLSERRVLSAEQVEELLLWAQSGSRPATTRPFKAGPRGRLSGLAELSRSAHAQRAAATLPA